MLPLNMAQDMIIPARLANNWECAIRNLMFYIDNLLYEVVIVNSRWDFGNRD